MSKLMPAILIDDETSETLCEGDLEALPEEGEILTLRTEDRQSIDFEVVKLDPPPQDRLSRELPRLTVIRVTRI